MRSRRHFISSSAAVLLAGWLCAGCSRELKPEPRLEVRVWRRGETATELASGASVRAGDELYMTLEIAARRALYVYVLSEDAHRARQVLYPCRGGNRSLPLAGRTRLPPLLLGRETFWPVATVTTHEHLRVLFSFRPVAPLEAAVAASGSPLCAVALGDLAGRWLDGLSLNPEGGGERFQGPRRESWRATVSGQEGWSLGFDFLGAASRG